MKKIIIANWKMNLGLKESISLAEEIQNGLRDLPENLEVVLCPSFTALPSVQPLIENLELGAQDVFWEARGVFTGEVSPQMLKELGCKYVIVGHSERRQNLAETDEAVHQKVRACLSNLLTPVICVGETFEQRQRGQKDYIVINQVAKAISGIEVAGNQQVVIAYEPVWVIGSGQAVAPEEAEYTSQVIKQELLDLFSSDVVARHFRIIYGGSVSSQTVKSFLDQPTIGGCLVGGASLKPKEFIKLVKELY